MGGGGGGGEGEGNIWRQTSSRLVFETALTVETNRLPRVAMVTCKQCPPCWSV